MEETLEISEKLLWELEFLWIAFLMGFFVRNWYDALIIFRRVVRHGYVWIGIEDFLYCAAVAVRTFMLFYDVNNGEPRGFAIISMAAGFTLYHFGPSWLVCFLCERIIHFLTLPIRRLVKFLKKLVENC